jgi:MoCo/4Fe-4S cofactor protein with predicted Tat translocation signal
VRYWRSLDELAQTPEFRAMAEREFPGEDFDRLPPATRRQFLKVIGASLGLAGLTACRWPKQEIVPFAHRPEDRTPGVPNEYATSMELGGVALGMVVTSFDGRPIKAEGNPRHPDSLGALSAIAQGTVLQMYDPDRSRRLLYRKGGQEYVKTWEEFGAFARERFAGSGEGVAVLAEPSSSEALRGQRKRFLSRLTGARWYEYEPLSRDNEREGTRFAFGRPLRIHPHLDRVRVIACFDADPFFEHPAALRLARRFVEARRPEGGLMPRLWVAESVHTLTGGRADRRLALPSSQVPRALAAVARRLAEAHDIRLPEPLRRTCAGASFDADFISDLARDLAEHRGKGVILVGPRQAPEVHALALALNGALGNAGTGVTYTEELDPDRPTHQAAIAELVGRMGSGEVKTLLVLGGNPVYDAPRHLGFAEALAKVGESVHLGLYDDETSRSCGWHLPRAHHLEAWGDGHAFDGTWTFQQPLIAPLFAGRSPTELLATVLGDQAVDGHDLLRAAVAERLPETAAEEPWRELLHDGTAVGSAWAEVTPRLDGAGLVQAADSLGDRLGMPEPTAEALELVLPPDSKVYDGRYANNAWLQELPDAITKITWDNALVLSPRTARELSLASGDVVRVRVGEDAVEAPVWVLPGVAAYCGTLALGYGRTAAGKVGDGVGVDAYALRSSGAMHLRTGVTLERTGRHHTLATTQNHWAIDTLGFEARSERSRELVREATVERFREEPAVFTEMVEHPPLSQLWEPFPYEGEQWGMAIDLNACIGCNACTVACQAENNVPVVGREQVIRQREMHWIRVDRYFKTPHEVGPADVDDAEMVFQPVPCMHCENAPCEEVCPVGATQHTPDGLNAMAYNRCIGTRYCSNNCPYKVRRFNFFNYHRHLAELSKMQMNPEVTVRSRGVMEKCTYCIQRIENVRITAHNERRPIEDGEIVTACAQTCPTRAITFGNVNDPESAVAKLRQDPRAYTILGELNVRPRTHYLGRLQNPVEAGHDGETGDADRAHGKESA